MEKALQLAKAVAVSGEPANIRASTSDGPKKIDAQKHGQWAYHLSVGKEGHSVTHIPSGLVMSAGMKEIQARRLAEHLHKETPDVLRTLKFGKVPTINKHKKEMQRLHDVYGDFYNKHVLKKSSDFLSKASVHMTAIKLRNSLQGGHYSIISAGKNPSHPEEKHLSDDHPKFAQRHSALRNDLDKHGLDHTEIEGHYGGKESSFIVHHNSRKNPLKPGFIVHHISPSEHAVIRELGAKYNQESVIHSDNSAHEMHYVTGSNSGTHHKGFGHTILSDAKDYYTDVAHPEGGHTKFSLNFDWDKHHDMSSALHKAVTEERDIRDQKRHLRPAGVASPSTPDDPDEGHDWHGTAKSLVIIL